MFTSAFGKRRMGRIMLVIALALLCATLPAAAFAENGDTPPPPFVAEIAANATVTIPIYGFCLNYTWPFPGQSLRPVELAPDTVRTAIGYILQKGYVITEPWQSQLAIWYFTEGGKVGETYEAVADEIIAYVEGGAPVPDAGSSAIPLPQAVADGIVTATIDDFQNASPPGFFFLGSGTLVVTNLTDEPIKVLIPFGTRFQDQGSQETQTMGVFPQPTAEPPTLPETGGLLAPEWVAALGLAGLGGGMWLLSRRRRLA